MTADRWTDQELEKLENRIAKEYKQAEKELEKKAQDYFREYAERWNREEVYHQAGMLSEDAFGAWFKKNRDPSVSDQELKSIYKSHTGKYTDQQFKAWELAQLGRGAHWEDLKDQMSERLAQSALIAQGYINDKLPAVYTKNSNEIAKIAQDSAMEQGVTGIRFDLADEYAVKRLMEGSREVRPYKPIAIDLPKTNRFNYTKLQNCLLQGILQGDSIEHIADRFMKVSDMNLASAIRNARTAVTGAQSAGKQDRYADIASKGGEVFKMWIATNDERTREEHSQAQDDYGTEETAIPYDEPFEVGGEPLMYPADPSGSGWNIYNCRCTTRSKIRFKSILSDEAREGANIHLIDDKALNEAITEAEELKKQYDPDYNCELAQKCGNDYYNQLHERVMNCENSDLIDVWKKYESEIKVKETNLRGTAYCDYSHSIFINTANDAKGNNYETPYQVTFHESGHAIDMITRNEGSGFGFYFSQSYENGLFPQTIRYEVASLVSDLDKKMKAEFKEHKGDYEWLHDHKMISDYNYSYYQRFGSFMREPTYSKSMAYKALEDEIKEIPLLNRGDLSDILEGATGGKISCGVGHGVSYWKDKSKLGTEAFAEMTSSTIANDGSKEVLKKYLPKSYGVYEDMLKALNTEGEKNG